MVTSISVALWPWVSTGSSGWRLPVGAVAATRGGLPESSEQPVVYLAKETSHHAESIAKQSKKVLGRVPTWAGLDVELGRRRDGVRAEGGGAPSRGFFNSFAPWGRARLEGWLRGETCSFAASEGLDRVCVRSSGRRGNKLLAGQASINIAAVWMCARSAVVVGAQDSTVKLWGTQSGRGRGYLALFAGGAAKTEV